MPLQRNWQSLIKPEKLAVESGSDPSRSATVIAEPLERGFGMTLGNAIRRIYGKPAEELAPAEWAEVAWNFGMGLRNLAALYAPDVIVIGGGMARQGEKLLGPARQVMTGHLKLVPAPRVVVSKLGYGTALRGALVLAREAAGLG